MAPTTASEATIAPPIEFSPTEPSPVEKGSIAGDNDSEPPTRSDQPRSSFIKVEKRKPIPRPITWRADLRYDAVDDEAAWNNPKRGDVWSLPAFRASLPRTSSS